jgi:hypothetical protein
VDAFKDLQMLDEHWLRVVHWLGMTTIAGVMPFARSNVHRLHGELALMLIQEGVITCIEELSWTAYEPDSSAGRSVEDPSFKCKAQSMIRVLLGHGIERQWIAGLFRFYMGSFDPEQLDANLATLADVGDIDLTAALDAVGERVWCAIHGHRFTS